MPRSVVSFVFLIAATVAFVQSPAASGIPENCLVTRVESQRFSPREAYRTAWGDTDDWYGTSKLWTRLRVEGKWPTTQKWLPKAVFRDKLFWWREGYNARYSPYRERKPNLIVTAKKLDGTGQMLTLDNATNAIRAGISAMLVLIDVPTEGCWQVTAKYEDANLSYIVWVGP